MPHSMHFPILTRLGLSSGEALIYELLLETGRKRARDLITPSGLGRCNVYNFLVQLEAKGLITAIKGKQKLYEAAPPAKLQELIDNQIREVKQLEKDYTSILNSFSSLYNLSTGKPAVEIFEGYDGWDKVLEGTLESKTEICAYVDISVIVDDLAKRNVIYLKKRIAKKIPKKIIVNDTSETRKFFNDQNTPFTSVGFLKNFTSKLSTSFQMYDNTIIYFSDAENKKISMVIRDPLIFKTHQDHFNYLWSLADVVDYAAINS